MIRAKDNISTTVGCLPSAIGPLIRPGTQPKAIQEDRSDPWTLVGDGCLALDDGGEGHRLEERQVLTFETGPDVLADSRLEVVHELLNDFLQGCVGGQCVRIREQETFQRRPGR
jgi:hypothetical protein